jgi:hypothetical protein
VEDLNDSFGEKLENEDPEINIQDSLIEDSS